MSCGFCEGVRQYAVNGLVMIDHVGNTILGGSPNETVSQRTARAELDGQRWAHVACAIMGWFNKDHCAWSLTPGTIAAEIWHWSPEGEHPQGAQS